MGFFSKIGDTLFGKRGGDAYGPSNAAIQQMEQSRQYTNEAYNPFIKQGQQANEQLNPLQSSMAQNPFQHYNQIMQNYQPSEGYGYRQEQLNRNAHNTAAAGGFAGTEGDVRNRSELMNALMGQDMQQYLQNILGIQGTGMQGLHDTSTMGYNAAGQRANDLMGINSSIAGLKYEGGMNAMQAKNNRRSNIFSTLSSLIGSPMGQAGMSKMGGMFGGGGGGGGGYSPLSGSSNMGNNIPLTGFLGKSQFGG